MLSYHLTTCPSWLLSSGSPTKPQVPEGQNPGPFLCTSIAVSSLISTQEKLSKFQWNGVENQTRCGLSSHFHPVYVFKPSFVGMPAVTHNIHPGQPAPGKSPLPLVSAYWMQPWCSASTALAVLFRLPFLMTLLSLLRVLRFVCHFSCASTLQNFAGAAIPKILKLNQT